MFICTEIFLALLRGVPCSKANKQEYNEASCGTGVCTLIGYYNNQLPQLSRKWVPLHSLILAVFDRQSYLSKGRSVMLVWVIKGTHHWAFASMLDILVSFSQIRIYPQTHRIRWRSVCFYSKASYSDQQIEYLSTAAHKFEGKKTVAAPSSSWAFFFHEWGFSK